MAFLPRNLQFYEAFPPVEARALAERFEIHYTPKHGSWLNVAEIELSALKSQCLKDRIPSLEEMQQRIKDWEEARNKQCNRIRWQFTTKDARIKLKRLYPEILTQN